MLKKIHLFFLTVLLINGCVLTMEIEEPQTHLLVIPGQNGFGGGNATNVLSYFNDKRHLVHYVETPSLLPDLGQNKCQNYLEQQINKLDRNDKVILHASSQGTATALNYAAKYPERVNALILEAIMLTGNSAVAHTVENLMLPGATSLPGSYHWMPYAAKVQYPYYSPAGEQPIYNIDKLPETLPIIIIHHDKDPQLSHKDAQALYAHLKEKNNNVYFISTTSDCCAHVNLLNNEKHAEEIETINHILKNNTLLPSNLVKNNNAFFFIDSKYQPEPKQEWKDHFNNLLNKENKFKFLDYCLKGIGCSIIALLLYKFGIIKKINTVSMNK